MLSRVSDGRCSEDETKATSQTDSQHTCMDMCIEIWVDIRAVMCADMCAGMCIGMHIDWAQPGHLPYRRLPIPVTVRVTTYHIPYNS